MKRPALFICFFYLVGLIVGYYVSNWLLIIAFFVLSIVVSVLLYKTYLWRTILFFPFICLFAYTNICNHMDFRNNDIDDLFDDSISCKAEGYVDSLSCMEDKIEFVLSADEITINNVVYNENTILKVYDNKTTDINIGDHIVVIGDLNKLAEPTNQGQFNEEKYYRVREIKYKLFLSDYEIITSKKMLPGLKYSIKRMLFDFKNEAIEIFDRILPNEQANLMKAMILGDKSYLSVDTKKIYAESGISHVLAISGLHIAILGYGFYRFICLLLSRKKGVIITIIFLVSYCILTGASVSTVRAVIMLSIILLAYYFGRTYDIYSSISTAAIILLTINPYNLWDTGFLLSFSAVIGIITIAPVLNQIYNKTNNGIISTFNVSLAATLGTMPVMLLNYYEIHIYSVLVNILVVPLMSIVVLFGFIGLVGGFFSVFIGKICSGIVFYILNFYDFCCNLVKYLPFNTITIGKPKSISLILYIVILILMALLANERFNKQVIKKYIIITVCGLLIINFADYIIKKPLKIVHLDIGQGDSAVVISPDRKVYVIDGGGNQRKKTTDRDTGYYILKPYLKYNGISKIDCLIMTHSDRDHVGGLIELIDYFKIKNIIVPYAYKHKKEEDILLEELINKASKKKINVVYLKENDIIRDRYINFEALYPIDEIKEFPNNNAYSLVLNLKYKSFNELFTGDIEKQEEQKINYKYTDYLNSDIMKVPHHGSNTSSTEEFIKNVIPKVAVISSGRNNKFGHPHKEILDRYEKYDIPIFNTAWDGAITIKTDGNNIGLSTYYSNRHMFIK
ncbi:ComE operon protein 3 [Vallitalea longa]|uniref:ComE operon protein 3 n=1 Tax=Vallitalea longa TaxID=2936439 RepID=A0A9W5YCV5_9FIRM|nr:DNA internalization-related competence protein ComEC/Rec2 [Vallitalea longa]GKX31137.1 ComE operon protein 3 [Vallitalea longa]